jgi:hypothetical protein
MNSDLKFCAEVAEKVLGWSLSDRGVWQSPEGDAPRDSQGACYACHGRDEPHCCFRPDIDANDDYLVLQHVREKWEPSSRRNFKDELQELWGVRNGYKPDLRGVQVMYYSPLDYQIGDYSRAALKALSYSVEQR